MNGIQSETVFGTQLVGTVSRSAGARHMGCCCCSSHGLLLLLVTACSTFRKKMSSCGAWCAAAGRAGLSAGGSSAHQGPRNLPPRCRSVVIVLVMKQHLLPCAYSTWQGTIPLPRSPGWPCQGAKLEDSRSLPYKHAGTDTSWPRHVSTN